jgi:hypothetical protein
MRKMIIHDSDVPEDWRMFEARKLQSLEGVLLTNIEMLGFEEKREKAIKDVFRQLLWDFWYQGQTPIDDGDNSVGQSSDSFGNTNLITRPRKK